MPIGARQWGGTGGGVRDPTETVADGGLTETQMTGPVLRKVGRTVCAQWECCAVDVVAPLHHHTNNDRYQPYCFRCKCSGVSVREALAQDVGLRERAEKLGLGRMMALTASGG